MEDRLLYVTDNEGKQHECYILFTYFNEETGKHYVVFQTDENSISAAEYTENDGGASGQLSQIQTQEEWEMLEDLLEEYAEKSKAQASCGGSCGGCGESCDCEGSCGDGCGCSQDK